MDIVTSGKSSKSLKIVLITLALVLVVAGLIYIYAIYDKPESINKSKISTQEAITEQAGALLSTAALVFPKVIMLSEADSSTVPKEVMSFLVDEAVQTRFRNIDYEGGDKGFHVTYIIENSDLMKEEVNFDNKFRRAKTEWVARGSSRSSLFAFYEYENNLSKDIARMSLIQNGDNVKVVVQTLITPK